MTTDRAFVLGTDDLYREMGYVAMSRGRLGNHLYVVGEPTREIEPLHGPSLERTNEELLVAALSTSRAQEMACVDKWHEPPVSVKGRSAAFGSLDPAQRPVQLAAKPCEQLRCGVATGLSL